MRVRALLFLFMVPNGEVGSPESTQILLLAEFAVSQPPQTDAMLASAWPAEARTLRYVECGSEMRWWVSFDYVASLDDQFYTDVAQRAHRFYLSNVSFAPKLLGRGV